MSQPEIVFCGHWFRLIRIKEVVIDDGSIPSISLDRQDRLTTMTTMKLRRNRERKRKKERKEGRK